MNWLLFGFCKFQHFKSIFLSDSKQFPFHKQKINYRKLPTFQNSRLKLLIMRMHIFLYSIRWLILQFFEFGIHMSILVSSLISELTMAALEICSFANGNELKWSMLLSFFLNKSTSIKTKKNSFFPILMALCLHL